MSRAQNGFTLIELMIVVAVLAIIATIAVPSYSHFTRRAHLRDAQAALMENAYALEQYYTRNHNFGTAAKRPPLVKSSTNHFNIAFASNNACNGTANDGDHYCLIASAKNTSSEPRVLVLTEAGQMQLCAGNTSAASCEAF